MTRNRAVTMLAGARGTRYLRPPPPHNVAPLPEKKVAVDRLTDKRD